MFNFSIGLITPLKLLVEDFNERYASEMLNKFGKERNVVASGVEAIFATITVLHHCLIKESREP